MTTRRVLACAAAVLLLTACGTGDAKDAVGDAKSKVSAAKDAADRTADEVKAIAAIVKADKALAGTNPADVLTAAKKTCAFIEDHSEQGAQLDEVRQRFDKVGATTLQASEAKAILKVMKSQVCPRLK